LDTRRENPFRAFACDRELNERKEGCRWPA
jgi:hypothetical protein